MLIKKLTLTNFGLHKSLSLSLNGTVVGLIGENGSGKSTVLEALRFALTGETEDTLSSYIRTGAQSAQVELDFVKNGQLGHIKRKIGKPNTRQLLWENKKYTKDKDVSRVLGSLLGCDKQAIANAVFVRQGSIQKVLFQTEAVRRSEMIKLVNMSHCASRAEVINGKVKKLESTLVSLTEVRDAAFAQREEAMIGLARIQEEMKKLRDYGSEIEFCQRQHYNQGRRTNVWNNLERKSVEAEKASERLQDLLRLHGVHEVSEYAYRLADLEKTLEGLRKERNAVVSILHKQETAKRIGKMLQEIESEISQAEQTITSRSGAVGVDWMRDRVKYLDEEIGNRRLVAGWQRSLDDFQKQQAQIKAELDSLKLGTMTDKQLEELRVNKRQLEVERSAIANQLAVCNEMLRCQQGKVVQGGTMRCSYCGLTLHNASELSPDYIRQLQTTVTSKDTEIATLTANIENEERQRRKETERQTALTARLNQCNGSIAHLTVTINRSQPRGEETNEALELEREHLTRSISEIDDATKALARLKKDKSELDVQISENSLNAEEQQVASTLTGDVLGNKDADIQEREAEIKRLREQQRQAHDAKNSWVSSLKSREEERVMLAEIEKEMRVEIPDIVSDMLSRSGGDYVTVLSHLKELQAARNECVGRHTEAQRYYEVSNSKYNEVVDRMQQDEAKRRMIDELKLLRELFVETGLPTDVVTHHFAAMAGITQQHLHDMDANFTVLPDPDSPLSFLFQRLDNSDSTLLPMNKLSSGQKIRLCIAFLLAVQKRLVNDVGLLILDEITMHVDDRGVDSLVELFQTFGRQLINLEMQVWIVDHNVKVQECLDANVKLS